ncbi:MAG: mechanosensitive ion channel family protein [Pseudomonadota bacterium]|nr:mechanosensitive ion channel family protein [Pseudomonadota bacterium]
MLQPISSFLTSKRMEDLLSAVLMIGIGFLIAKLLSNTVIKTMGRRFNSHQRLIWGRGIFYFIFILFVFSGLREAGFNLGIFLGAAGILTVAIGFASQTSASNLISGLFLIGEGPFEIGDYIRVDNIEGVVLSIDLLSVKLRTLDNIYIRLPNEQLIKSPVQNLTRFPIRRVPITIAVAYGENIERVRKALLQLASEYPLALNDPQPDILIQRFRDSNIELLFGVWTQSDHFLQVRDEMHEVIKEGFKRHGINIPLPQITVHHIAPTADMTSAQFTLVESEMFKGKMDLDRKSPTSRD